MVGRLFSFVGGAAGRWQVTSMAAVMGTPLETVSLIDMREEDVSTLSTGAAWVLRGVTSYERYVNRAEQQSLIAAQPPLDRPEATCAALIPVKKSARWWALPQDERRTIFEESSHHIQTGLQYLPAIARRLHHCYELGEPFDFLTWFEYAPQNAESFEQLTRTLRSTEEWAFVEREIDIRLLRC
jgi:chlorite dismutase